MAYDNHADPRSISSLDSTGILGTNPLPPDHPRYKDWETASRDAQEKWSRFAADHLNKLPSDSDKETVHAEWLIAAFVQRFDLRAKAYCDLFVTSYRLADLYSKELLPATVKETLAHAESQNGNFVQGAGDRIRTGDVQLGKLHDTLISTF